MTPMTARGVPRSLQSDAWWSAAESGDAGATGMGLPIVRRLLAAQAASIALDPGSRATFIITF